MVRAAREARGWTQERLGEAVGCTKANVSHWETAKHDPSYLQLLAISEHTGVALAGGGDQWPFEDLPKDVVFGLDPAVRQALERFVLAVIGAMRQTPFTQRAFDLAAQFDSLPPGPRQAVAYAQILQALAHAKRSASPPAVEQSPQSTLPPPAPAQTPPAPRRVKP